MPLPKYFEMHKPFLEYLGDGKEHKLKELKVYVSQQFGLTEEELAELLPSGRQTVFINRQRKSTEENEETPDDIFEDAFKKINRGLQDELLNEVMKLSPQAFEQMVLELSKMLQGLQNSRMMKALTGSLWRTSLDLTGSIFRPGNGMKNIRWADWKCRHLQARLRAEAARDSLLQHRSFRSRQ